jgi:NDP-sugar pyrophosphorylase family protein
MLKIIVPLAGPSDLFVNAGYSYPKPLIEINGITMIQMVIDRIKSIQQAHRIIFILKEEDVQKFHLDNTLRLLSPDCEIVKLKHETKGALCSILMAVDKIDKEDSLLILNGDQIIDTDFEIIKNHWTETDADVGVVTFNSVHPRWSFAKIENDKVVQTAEKNPISNNAIAGYYYFKNAGLFLDCAYQCILNDVQLDGRYYISPVINEYILKQKKAFHYPIDKASYHSFYSPQMINEYLKATAN